MVACLLVRSGMFFEFEVLILRFLDGESVFIDANTRIICLCCVAVFVCYCSLQLGIGFYCMFGI